MASVLGQQRYAGFTLEPNSDDVRVMADRLESGAVTPVIERR